MSTATISPQQQKAFTRFKELNVKLPKGIKRTNFTDASGTTQSFKYRGYAILVVENANPSLPTFTSRATGGKKGEKYPVGLYQINDNSIDKVLADWTALIDKCLKSKMSNSYDYLIEVSEEVDAELEEHVIENNGVSIASMTKTVAKGSPIGKQLGDGFTLPSSFLKSTVDLLAGWTHENNPHFNVDVAMDFGFALGLRYAHELEKLQKA